MWLLMLAQLWTSYPDSTTLLRGAWQSCLQDDQTWSERVYDRGQAFELHMGPRDEFALFKGVQDAHRDHDSPDNLLKGYHALTPVVWRGKRNWTIPSLKLRFEISQIWDEADNCLSWWIQLSSR